MTEYADIYELLETVRTYKLRPRESMVPTNSMTGATIGYATADSSEPSIEWTMPLKLAKETALARGTKEARYIRELLSSYMGRKQLLEELRAGTLEYGLAAPPKEEHGNGFDGAVDGSDAAERVRIPDLPANGEPRHGPRQCYIPGL